MLKITDRYVMSAFVWSSHTNRKYLIAIKDTPYTASNGGNNTTKKTLNTDKALPEFLSYNHIGCAI